MESNKEHRAPLIEHIRELRARVFWCILFVGAGAGVGYVLHDRLMEIIQKPINQTLYYTAPTGALTFVLKICVTFGVIMGLPAIMYHIFAFLGPLLTKKSKIGIIFFTLLSMTLAVAGVVFSYFVTLPAALHFLVGFGSKDIHSLITADEYFSFAFAYIVGFAVLFQIPLLLLFINRIHRLPPGKLLASIRYVVVICFVLSAILTPTPDPLNQTLMAAPAIGLYLVSAIVVSILNMRYWRRQKRQAALAAQPLPTPAQPPVAQPPAPKQQAGPAYPIKREFVKQPLPLAAMAAKSVNPVRAPVRRAPPVALAPNRHRRPVSHPGSAGPLTQAQLAARLRPHSPTRVDTMMPVRRPARSVSSAPVSQLRTAPTPRPAAAKSYNIAPGGGGIVRRRPPGFISDFVSG